MLYFLSLLELRHRRTIISSKVVTIHNAAVSPKTNTHHTHTCAHTIFPTTMPLNWKLSFGPSSVLNPSAGQSVSECPDLT